MMRKHQDSVAVKTETPAAQDDPEQDAEKAAAQASKKRGRIQRTTEPTDGENPTTRTGVAKPGAKSAAKPAAKKPSAQMATQSEADTKPAAKPAAKQKEPEAKAPPTPASPALPPEAKDTAKTNQALKGADSGVGIPTRHEESDEAIKAAEARAAEIAKRSEAAEDAKQDKESKIANGQAMRDGMTAEERKNSWAKYVHSLKPCGKAESTSEKCPEAVSLQLVNLTSKQTWYKSWLDCGKSWLTVMVTET